MIHPSIRILADAVELNEAAAREFCRCAKSSIERKKQFTVALSGGSTPRSVYSLIAEWHKNGLIALDWNNIFIFFGDERHVPPDHPDSNYRMANETLLSQVPLPSQNIFRIPAELDAATASQRYEDQLRNLFALQPGEWPRFDLILLGLGDDGHTASLFPDTAALRETQDCVVANWVKQFKQYRITFTFPVLNHASDILFLVSGNKKANILKAVLEDGAGIYPAQQIQPVDGQLLWLVDRQAASSLKTVSISH